MMVSQDSGRFCLSDAQVSFVVPGSSDRCSTVSWVGAWAGMSGAWI